ncbi:hypothetical protein LXL04_027027 [Taraxacum kok-saghyz]
MTGERGSSGVILQQRTQSLHHKSPISIDSASNSAAAHMRTAVHEIKIDHNLNIDLQKISKQFQLFTIIPCSLPYDIRTGVIIGRDTECQGLYYVDEVNQHGTVMLTHGTTERQAWLWHRRLGHPSTSYMHLLLPQFSISKNVLQCETCVLAKSHRQTYKPSNTRVEFPFSLIHSDVWGPAKVLGGQDFKYFLLFVDDCTRMIWIYFLKHKSEVPEKFANFHTMIQTQFQKLIQILRSDNGGEFVNTTMKLFCQDKGIIHQTTNPNTLEQNGVAERKNRIILEITRALIIDSQIPTSFWTEAVATAAYLINRLPTKALELKTPLQTLSEFTKIPPALTLQPRDDTEEISHLRNNLFTEFEMKDLGRLKYFLGIEVLRSSGGIFISQRKYVLDLLAETGMLDCKPNNTPMIVNHKLKTVEGAKLADREKYQRLVGKLIYLVHTRPDIAYAVGVVSQFMHEPQTHHMEAVMRIVRYLKGSPGKGVIEAFTDADWAGNQVNRRSTAGYFTFVGGNLVTWRSKKQKVVSLSSAEAEFRGILMDEIGFPLKTPTKLFCDNEAAISISENPIQHDRTKHVEVDRHFIKETIENRIVELPCIRSEDQLADILTKAVTGMIFESVLRKLSIEDPTAQLEGEC